MWKHTRYMLRSMSHHSLWSEAAGLADTMALHACVAVSLTHSFHMELWNLQNQTQLLAEQQLHDWDTARTLNEFIIRGTQFASCTCESQWGNQTKGHTHQLSYLLFLVRSTQHQSHDSLQTPSPAGRRWDLRRWCHVLHSADDLKGAMIIMMRQQDFFSLLTTYFKIFTNF